MTQALIVTHLEDRHSGLVRDSFKRAGCAVREWNPLDEIPFPRLDEIAGIVSLGGRMSATEIERHSFLADEVSVMGEALEAGVPILGMCLGAQLLAVASGGHVTTLPEMYVGWPGFSPLPAAAADPLFGPVPADVPVLKWHEDGIEAPAAATVLATTASPGAALFRVGARAWGSQMHLEVTPSMLLDGWLREAGSVTEIEGAGYEIGEFRRDSARRLELQMAACEPVFDRFAQLVRSVAAGLERQSSPGLVAFGGEGGGRAV